MLTASSVMSLPTIDQAADKSWVVWDPQNGWLALPKDTSPLLVLSLAVALLAAYYQAESEEESEWN